MSPALVNPHLALLGAEPRLVPAAALAVKLAAAIQVWSMRHRTRHQLRDLDDHLLNDIGVTRREAFGEARRAFWRG